MSSPVLDAAASVTSEELSIMIYLSRFTRASPSQPVRPDRPEDYTVPRCIPGGLSDSARERKLCPGRKQQNRQQDIPSPHGAIACVISHNISTEWLARFANSSKSSPPVTTSRRSTTSQRSWRPNLKRLADGPDSTLATTSATVCKLIFPELLAWEQPVAGPFC